MIPIILCGGFGTKMWPLSRQHQPKHFLPLINGKSLFEINYASLLARFKPEEIYISTNPGQVEFARTQAPEVPAENFILEPEMRNQGPATGLVAAFLFKKGLADEPFMILQVDVLRYPKEKFFEMMDICDKLARQGKEYITGGIKPKFAMMGVDYLAKGEKVTDSGEVGVYKVDKFIWRGTKEQVEELVKQGSVVIHTNHTCMTPRNFLAMMQKYRLDWYEPLNNIANGADITTEYAKMPPGPVEEVAQIVHQNRESLVVELPFNWVDIGTWESLDRYLRENSLLEENTVINIASENNFVKTTDPKKTIALVGVNNLAIIDTPDGLLICAKENSGRVNEVVKEIEKRGLNTL